MVSVFHISISIFVLQYFTIQMLTQAQWSREGNLKRFKKHIYFCMFVYIVISGVLEFFSKRIFVYIFLHIVIKGVLEVFRFFFFDTL